MKNRQSQICSIAILAICLSGSSWSRAGAIVIENTDNREMNDLTVEVDYFIASRYTHDWEDLPGRWAYDRQFDLGLNNSRCSCDGRECSGDCLYSDRLETISGRRIRIEKLDSETYQDLHVYVTFNVDGACHWDWETLGRWDGSSDICLELDGRDASWDGLCWYGDLVHRC